MTDYAKVDNAREFVQAMLNRYASYHQNKESMAYAGITLFGGIAGASVLSKEWPPDWGSHTLLLAVLSCTFLWVIILTFIRFQLTRRRWAALRVAGCDRLLSAWIQNAPTEDDLALLPTKARPSQCICIKILNCLWGNKEAVRAVNTKESVYPGALVEEWLSQEERGTDALKHERLVLLSGWVFYLIMILKVLLKKGTFSFMA